MEPILSAHDNNLGSQGLLDDRSSFTDGSASVQPTKPSKVRDEDAKKFVSRRDVQAKTNLELQEIITKVEGLLLQVSTELAAIQYAVQWRISTHESFNEFAKIKATLCKVENKLHGTRGIDKHIAAVIELGAIPSIIQRVQKLEIECLLSQTKLVRLEALCGAKQYQQELIKAKALIPTLFVSLPLEIDSFVKTVDTIIKAYVESVDPKLSALIVRGNKSEIDEFVSTLSEKKIVKVSIKTERIKQRATKWIYLQTLKASLVLAKKSDVGGRLEWRVQVLKSLVTYIERDLGVKELIVKEPQKEHTAQEAAAYGSWFKGKVVPIKRVDELTMDELISIQEITSHEYGFWKHAPSKQKWYNWGKYYAVTGALGTDMDRDIGQTLHGLHTSLKKRIIYLAQGDAEPVEKKTLKEELNFYQRAIYSLETMHNEYFEKICAATYDDLTLPLFDYAFGVSQAIEEAKSLLKLASKCTKSSAQAVFLAINEIEKHYGKYDSSLELDNVLKLYHSVVQMKLVAETVPKTASKPFDLFLERTAEYLHEVHATKDPAILKLTELELKVPLVVLGGRSIDGLYLADEGKMALPQVIITYLAKRIMQQLFLPSDTYDMELELVLFELRTKFYDQYYESLNFYDNIRPILGGYEKAYLNMRLDPVLQLEPAINIALLSFRALNSSWDLLSYAEGWQRLFEFGRASEDKRIVAMGSMLAGRLHEAATKNEHDIIYPVVATNDIETWNIATPAEFLQQLQREAQQEQIGPQCLFGSILLRMVAACLYATDTAEQVAAQQRVIAILQTPAYATYIDELSDDLKMLLAENAMKKVFFCADTNEKHLKLEAKEIDFLLAGPVGYFFAQPFLNPDTTIIQMVLYKLIKQEGRNGPLATKCAENWGREFERWYEGYNLLSQGNPIKAGLDRYRQDNELLF